MLVSSHTAVADIGCDHGYLAIELLRSGKAERVIAMDVNEGPLARAKENRDTYGFSDTMETRLSNGMEALRPGEVQAVICAGMGGKTICGIIGRSHLLAQELDELVLQPQSELHIVRRYLRENGFCIAAEDMVSEEGKFYPMMRVIPMHKADGVSHDEKAGGVCKADGTHPDGKTDVQRQRVEDRYGPCLLAGAHPVLQCYLQKEKAVCTEILHSLKQADSVKGEARRRELLQRLSDIAFADTFYGRELCRGGMPDEMR